MRAGESLTYINGRGEQVVLAARNNPAYWLSSAEGIDGLESEMFSARGAGQDGETLSGTALQARVITVEGRVMPKKGAYLGRRELLRVVNPKLEGRLCIGTRTGASPATSPAACSRPPSSPNRTASRSFSSSSSAPTPIGGTGTARRGA